MKSRADKRSSQRQIRSHWIGKKGSTVCQLAGGGIIQSYQLAPASVEEGSRGSPLNSGTLADLGKVRKDEKHLRQGRA